MADLSAKMAARRKKLEEEGEDAYYFKSPDSGPRNKPVKVEKSDPTKQSLQNGNIHKKSSTDEHSKTNGQRSQNESGLSADNGSEDPVIQESDDEEDVEDMITQYQKQLREKDHASVVSLAITVQECLLQFCTVLYARLDLFSFSKCTPPPLPNTCTTPHPTLLNRSAHPPNPCAAPTARPARPGAFGHASRGSKPLTEAGRPFSRRRRRHAVATGRRAAGRRAGATGRRAAGRRAVAAGRRRRA
jgi:hypothetical protein